MLRGEKGFIQYGSEGHEIILGSLGINHCDNCGKNENFVIKTIYKRTYVYWVFSFVSEKKYFAVCEVCGRGWQLNEYEVEKSMKENNKEVPIPVMHRFGCLGLIIIVVLFMIFSNAN